MKNIKQLKQDQYEYIYKYYSFIAKWKPYYYRKIKTVIYVNVCAVLIYLFLRLKVKPNTVTLIYGLMGLAAGIFLILPNNKLVLTAAALLYFRPFLDWADGPLARELKQTSITGDILDSYGAYLGWMAMWVGLGAYLGRTTNNIFYILSPVLIFFFSIDLYSIARERFIYHHLNKAEQEKIKTPGLSFNPGETNPRGGALHIRNLKNKIGAFFEHNAQTVDLICLALLLEVTLHISVLWVYYLGFLFWQGFVFLLRFLILYKGGWAEEELRKLKGIIYDRD